MLDNRTKRELTEKDVMEEEDREERQLFEDQDDWLFYDFILLFIRLYESKTLIL